MNSTVTTALIDATTAERYRASRRAFEDAWGIWLPDLIAALNAQRQEAGLLDDSAPWSAVRLAGCLKSWIVAGRLEKSS